MFSIRCKATHLTISVVGYWTGNTPVKTSICFKFVTISRKTVEKEIYPPFPRKRKCEKKKSIKREGKTGSRSRPLTSSQLNVAYWEESFLINLVSKLQSNRSQCSGCNLRPGKVAIPSPTMYSVRHVSVDP